MFDYLPKVTEGNLKYMKEVLLDQLLRRPSGVSCIEEEWNRMYRDLDRVNPVLADAVRCGVNTVVENLRDKLPPDTNIVAWTVGIAQLSVLALVDRRMEEEDLRRRLGI
jgi:hypothetical protein